MLASKSVQSRLSYCLNLVLFVFLFGHPNGTEAIRVGEIEGRSVSYVTKYAIKTLALQETGSGNGLSPSELKRRQDCPVPCGFYSQLCCNSNEICYTAPNLQAQCSATALPSSPSDSTTTELTTTVMQHTETVVTAIRITWNATVRTVNGTVKTSLVTLTSTSTATTSVAVPGDSGNSTQPLNAQKSQHTGLSDSEKAGAIGGSIGGVFFLVLAFLLARYFRKRRNRRNEKEEFEDMQSDGAGTFRMVDTANIHSSQNVRPQNSTRSLQPKSRPFLFGRNPYEQPSPRHSGPPWSPDDVQGAPNPESRSTTPAHHYPNGSPDAGPSRQSYENVPPPNMVPRRMSRRPVPGRQPTVEEEF